MANANDCKQNTDPLKLVHEGANQNRRFPDELNPIYAPIDGHKLQHAMVFAKNYAKFLKFYGQDNTVIGNWTPFFGNDAAVQLAVAAIQDIEEYKSHINVSLNFLNDRANDIPAKAVQLKQHLGFLFAYLCTLAKQLDLLKTALPEHVALKSTLQNLIQTQLATAFRKLVAYYKAFPNTDADFNAAKPDTGLVILDAKIKSFGILYVDNFSKDWMTSDSPDWKTYATGIPADSSVYGTSANVFMRINHIATHNLFTGIFDQFLKAYARTVAEASKALQQNLTGRNDHEPHYALLLAFLKLLDYAREEANTLTARHLDFYYRDVLRLQEKPIKPEKAHLVLELAKHAESHELKQGELFKAGKDALGVDVVFANDRDFVANRAKIDALKTLYRHKNVQNDSKAFADNRLFASPIANSDDGMEPKLTAPDQSWQPFFNKVYKDGKLDDIKMPYAEIGFAVASHHLLLAEGTRNITLKLIPDASAVLAGIANNDIACFLTGEKGWFQVPAGFAANAAGQRPLTLTLDGAMPAVTPYAAKIHGYSFDTDLPMLLLKLAHRANSDYSYDKLQGLTLQQLELTVDVQGLKTLAVSNDFGPIDLAKPFQPFGALPVSGSALVIGANEAFQKQLSSCKLKVSWQVAGAAFTGKTVSYTVDFLQAGQWQSISVSESELSQATEFGLTNSLDKLGVDAPNFSGQDHHNTASRHGYLRLKMSGDFGQSDYQKALIEFIAKTRTTLPAAPVAPTVAELSLSYTATQTIALNVASQESYEQRKGRFFHITPFGYAEQHPFLKETAPNRAIYLLTQFSHINKSDKNAFAGKSPEGQNIPHTAEFYLGISSLKPPQNLALYFKVADGTANPLLDKPKPHIHWSYLSNNEWFSFAENDIEDGTGGLLNSGIITFAVPDKASATNTSLPAGQHWLRAAVAEHSDAVCRIQMVAAQGLAVTFSDQSNDPAFSATPLPQDTISKLAQPVAAVKGVSQPFPGFGGTGKEATTAFYTRISERLRHKDRAVTFWDYEHLLLEAFPQIYQAKCLNHTRYEPDVGQNKGYYQELAPGHVTVVTIPNQQAHQLRDPLRPFTSLGLLKEIDAFLRQRLSCFITLHVRNPVFEEVAAQFKVRFHPSYDDTFYKNKLAEAITRFLSPWAFPDGGRPMFGGKIYRSVVINFVEEQHYVDYVIDFKLSHTYQQLNAAGVTELKTDPDLAEIAGSKAISILVSARDHDIVTINPAQEASSGASCPCESV